MPTNHLDRLAKSCAAPCAWAWALIGLTACSLAPGEPPGAASRECDCDVPAVAALEGCDCAGSDGGEDGEAGPGHRPSRRVLKSAWMGVRRNALPIVDVEALDEA